jgi:hypothetical protein
MESINKKSFLQNANEPVEKGLTSPSPKEVSNKNYLVKKTSPLNSILNANKKTLGSQEVSWTAATKAALASTGVLSALGLSYLGYQYFGAKSVPSPLVLTHISIGDLVGTTIKVVGGLGFLTLMYAALGKREPAKSLENKPIDFQNESKGVEKEVIERFEAAEKEFENDNIIFEAAEKGLKINIDDFTAIYNIIFEAAEREFKTNIDAFTKVCEFVVCSLDLQVFSSAFISEVLVSIQKKITNPDERTCEHYHFSRVVESLFKKLLEIDTDSTINSARDIAIRCVNIIKNKYDIEINHLFFFSDSIIRTAFKHPKIGFEVAMSVAQQKNNLLCDELARNAFSVFFTKDALLFAEFLKKIALGDNESVQKSILDGIRINKKRVTQLALTQSEVENKAKAFNMALKILDIFIEAKNYKMAASLLQKFVASGVIKLEDVAQTTFYEHKDALLEACPVTANQLSDHFQKLVEDTKKDLIEHKQKTLPLEG